MNNSKIASLSKTALLTLGCALSLALFSAPALKADSATPPAAAAKKLPLTATFEKAAHPAENTPPFILKLKNDSSASIKVSGKVLLSVVAHNADKARPVPAHVIEAGQTMTIGDLAALDKVILTADGFSPLELEVK